MKNFVRSRGFLAFFIMVLLTTTLVFAKDWSAEQKNVLNRFKEYVAANLKGNVKEIMTYFHPKFTSWDYAQELPANYDALRKMMDDFFKSYKLIKFDVVPLEIQVEGNIAIVHLKYSESFSDSSGKEIVNSGPWTVTMVKQGDKWFFLSYSWIAK